MRFIHNVTVWRNEGVDFQGAPDFSGPVSARARWEDRSSVFIDADGKQNRSESTIYVDKEFKRGDFIVFGKSTDSSPPAEAREIKDVRNMPNLSGTKVERRLLL